MRRYRPLPAVSLPSSSLHSSAGCSGRACSPPTTRFPNITKRSPRRSARSNRATSTKSIPIGSSTARSAACSGRSIRIQVFSIRVNTRRCASARKGATTASGSRFRRWTATSARTACSRDRPRTRGACGAATCISKIGTEDTKGWTSLQAQNKLRGPKGTSVQIEIKRQGYAQPIPIDVTRDEVYIPTVPAAFMVDATTGYIRHKDWGENTDHDIRLALQDLSSKGMRRLLYDIRGNPGGPLDQAIKAAQRISAPRRHDRLHARPHSRIRIRTTARRKTASSRTSRWSCSRTANSASASEIFTGAMQDHDRAYIVGETTFGKALVQSVYRISGGAGLALTTAHYFTPAAG